MIHLPQINSTNKYAKQRIKDALSVHGEVIWTSHQTEGKGQREKVWNDEPGNSVLMSLVLLENLEKFNPFTLNALVSVNVCKYLQTLSPKSKITVKWPNDIFIGDKKTCGILIENGWKGQEWIQSVVGIGINVRQKTFPSDILNATSLWLETGKEIEIKNIIIEIKNSLLKEISSYSLIENKILASYNEWLYKRGQLVLLENLSDGARISGTVLGVSEQGELILKTESQVIHVSFGTVKWILDQ